MGDYTLGVSQPSLVVVQGTTAGLDVTVSKLDVFDGDVTLSFEGLPTGLTPPAVPVTIPAGATMARVDFAAAADATVTSAEITVPGKTACGLDRTATFSATVQAAPGFTIAVDRPAINVTRGGDVSITVTVAKD